MTIERSQSPQPVEPGNPPSLAAALYTQNLWLRDLLTSVAEELERLAGEGGPGSRVLLDRAMLIRRRLWESGRGLC